MGMKSEDGLLPGFVDPVRDSTQTFRTIMNAMARPGRVYQLPALPESPAPLYAATGAVCLTLLDLETPLWLDHSASSRAVMAYLKFHCGCPISSGPGDAAYAVIGDGRTAPELSCFRCGDPIYPDQSATVIIQVESLSNSRGTRLTGPGIETEIHLHATGVSGAFWPDLKANNEQFPLGVDVLLVSPASICGLPRTVEVSLGEPGKEESITCTLP
jgi:alpha-D-ribose 1-methylphosphonate 5-triphosphate synthase subunit PhnH